MIWAVLLAGIAGYVDAICYLRLGGAFAANMTGNLVELGINAAAGRWSEAGWCLSLLAAFLLGTVLARWVIASCHSTRLALLAEIAMIAAAATGALGRFAVPLLAAAMAAQNEAVRHGIVAVNVAFISGDIQRLGERLIGSGDRSEPGHSRTIIAVLLCYAAGAAVGALASDWNAAALFAPAAALLVAAALPQRWTGLADCRL